MALWTLENLNDPLTAWYEGDGQTGYSNNDSMDTVYDTSGNERHGNQADDLRPLYIASMLNSLPGMRFDGIDDMFILPGLLRDYLESNNGILFMVIKPTADGLNTGCCFSDDNSNISFNYGAVDSGEFSETNWGVSAAANVSNWHLVSLTFGDDLVTLSVDGGTTVDSASFSGFGSSESVQTGFGFTGDWTVLLTSNVNYSSDDVDKLFGWAAHKYNLSANLPGGHPYKAAAPTLEEESIENIIYAPTLLTAITRGNPSPMLLEEATIGIQRRTH